MGAVYASVGSVPAYEVGLTPPLTRVRLRSGTDPAADIYLYSSNASTRRVMSSITSL
jgi:hypothetical protein